jgi:hypothetical protein
MWFSSVSVVPKYLNSATSSKALFAIFMLCFCTIFWPRDINIYLVFSKRHKSLKTIFMFVEMKLCALLWWMGLTLLPGSKLLVYFIYPFVQLFHAERVTEVCGVFQSVSHACRRWLTARDMLVFACDDVYLGRREAAGVTHPSSREPFFSQSRASVMAHTPLFEHPPTGVWSYPPLASLTDRVWLSSGVLRLVVWQILTDVSEMLTAIITRAFVFIPVAVRALNLTAFDTFIYLSCMSCYLLTAGLLSSSFHVSSPFKERCSFGPLAALGMQRTGRYVKYQFSFPRCCRTLSVCLLQGERPSVVATQSFKWNHNLVHLNLYGF